MIITLFLERRVDGIYVRCVPPRTLYRPPVSGHSYYRRTS